MLANIPEKELFNRSTLDKMSLAKMANEHQTYIKQRKFFDEINNTFKEITDGLNS